jgi:hypothetical protein
MNREFILQLLKRVDLSYQCKHSSSWNEAVTSIRAIKNIIIKELEIDYTFKDEDGKEAKAIPDEYENKSGFTRRCSPRI